MNKQKERVEMDCMEEPTSRKCIGRMRRMRMMRKTRQKQLRVQQTRRA
jgi:hypothetical protein